MLKLPGRLLFRYDAFHALPVCHVLVKPEHVEDMKKELRKATSICTSRSLLTSDRCRTREWDPLGVSLCGVGLAELDWAARERRRSSAIPDARSLADIVNDSNSTDSQDKETIGWHVMQHEDDPTKFAIVERFMHKDSSQEEHLSNPYWKVSPHQQSPPFEVVQ